MKALLIMVLLLYPHAVFAEFFYPVGNKNEKPMPPGYPNLNGYQITRGFNNYQDHTGVDLSNNSEGGYVRAITDGTVIIRCDAVDPTDNYACSGFGNVLVIRHNLSDRTYYSLYAHLKHGSLRVNKNSTVDAGQIIAEVNCTGYSLGSSTCESNGGKGPHLHFAVKKLGQIGCAYVGPGDCKNSGETINDYVEPLAFITTRRNSASVDEFWFREYLHTDPGIGTYHMREAFARRSFVKEYNCVFSSEYSSAHPGWTHIDAHFVWNDVAGFYTGVGDATGIGIDIINNQVCGAFFDPSDPVYDLICDGPTLTKVSTWAQAKAGDNGYCESFP